MELGEDGQGYIDPQGKVTTLKYQPLPQTLTQLIKRNAKRRCLSTISVLRLLQNGILLKIRDQRFFFKIRFCQHHHQSGFKLLIRISDLFVQDIIEGCLCSSADFAKSLILCLRVNWIRAQILHKRYSWRKCAFNFPDFLILYCCGSDIDWAC